MKMYARIFCSEPSLDPEATDKLSHLSQFVTLFSSPFIQMNFPFIHSEVHVILPVAVDNAFHMIVFSLPSSI